MLAEHISAYTKGWIVKRDTDVSPRRIADDDVDFLCRVVAAQAGIPADDALRTMRETLEGWLMQRARGERPSGFNMGDFETFLAFLPAENAFSETETVDALPASESVGLGDGDVRATSSSASVALHEVNDSAHGVGREETGLAVGTTELRETRTPTRRLPREMPAHDLFGSLEFSRFHVEYGV